ncbi:MAG: serine/threonine-protein kinase [Planctomycetota bacterium]
MATTLKDRRLRKGETIASRYQVVRRLGEGGAGSVYRCRDLKTEGDEVAVKVLENLEDMPRFRREARVMAKTRHPHVVQLLGRGVHEGEMPYLVLEYMDGGSVRDLLDRRGKVPVEEACWILMQSISGLKATKSVHRDLKPENLLMSKGAKGRGVTLMPGDVENGAVLKVADFGLAKSRARDSLSLTHTGQVMGTPVYMSPEQCKNTKRVSVKTDIYALGVILYELTAGKPPFDANNIYDIMNMHCSEKPKLGRVPAELRPIVARCLQKKPGSRYPTLAALERELERVSGLRNEEKPGSGLKLFIGVVILCAIAAAGIMFRDQVVGWYHQVMDRVDQAVGDDADTSDAEAPQDAPATP